MTRQGQYVRAALSALAPFAALALAAACSQPPPPPSAPLPALKPAAAAPKPAAAVSAGQAVTEWVYSPGKLRDPFVRLIKTQKAARKVDPAKLTPLQRFEIPSLRLGAIIIMGKKAAAQVSAPDGKAYTLKVGTLVGPNGAFVKKITSDSVILVEDYEDFLGRRLQQETVMPLHKKEGESQP
jgi:Tfp pilus assembly protein PilP